MTPLNRRDFVKLGAALGAGAFLSASARDAAALPATPGFKTRHLVAIILGSGARKVDVIGNEANAPFQSAMVSEGTLFAEDYGETANLHGYMYTEVLTGRDAPSQRPLYPTWNEYVRKKTGAKATDFWMLQGVSFYRGFTWDVKHFSQHPDYGVGYGATSLTMNKVFRATCDRSPRELVNRHVEQGLGHSASERERIAAWIAEARSSRRYYLPSTKEPVIEREVQIGDCQALHLAGDLLEAFKPRILTVQVLGLDDAHSDLDFSDHGTHYDRYVKHIKTTDELIGNLWRRIRSDPYLRETTSLVIRPECGRDDEVNRFGQLGHSPGNRGAHYVWTLALGPDFKQGHVVAERVQRRDLAPTLTYLMSGQNAEHATGHVRTQMFADGHGMPRYVLPPTVEMKAPGVN